MVKSSAKLTKRTVDAARRGRVAYRLGRRIEGICAEGRRERDQDLHPPLSTSRHRTGRSEALHGVGATWGENADEARAQAKSILGAVAAGKDPAKERSQANSAMPIVRLVELFINQHARPKRKARTAASYAEVLNNYLVPKLEERRRTK